jgi:uridylate kinase
MKTPEHTFVLSLGGSLVVPNGGIDIEFLKAFNTFIHNQVLVKKRRFFIVVGGGTTAGKYIDAGKSTLGYDITKEDQDWLGIHATRLNAQLIRTLFKDIADPRVIKHYEIILKIDRPVAIAAGWKPGWSTDYDAVVLCQDYGIKEVFNLSNIDKIYNKDPKTNSDAVALDSMSWKEYRKMVGDSWEPRMNVPFDPVAAKLGQELGVRVRFVNGKNLENLARALDGKTFIGTTIQPT